MTEDIPPLSYFAKEKLALSFVKEFFHLQRFDREEYKKLLVRLRTMNAQEEDVHEALETAIRFLDERLASNLRSPFSDSVGRTFIGAFGAGVAAELAAAFVAKAMGLSETGRDTLMLGSALVTGVTAGALVNVAITKLQRKRIRQGLEILGRANRWWGEEMQERKRSVEE